MTHDPSHTKVNQSVSYFLLIWLLHKSFSPCIDLYTGVYLMLYFGFNFFSATVHFLSKYVFCSPYPGRLLVLVPLARWGVVSSPWGVHCGGAVRPSHCLPRQEQHTIHTR